MEGKVELVKQLLIQSRLVRLSISNFKSLRNVSIDFPEKLTITIGPNGSGKTALIEAIELLHDILNLQRGRIINPFTKWWRYENVVWQHRSDLPIMISITLKLSKHQRLVNSGDFDEEIWEIISNTDINYLVKVKEVGNEVVLSDTISFSKFGFSLSFTGGNVVLKIENSDNFRNYVIRMISEKIMKSLDRLPKSLSEINCGVLNIKSFIDSLIFHTVLVENIISGKELNLLIELFKEDREIKERITRSLRSIEDFLINTLNGLRFSLTWHSFMDTYLGLLRELKSSEVDLSILASDLSSDIFSIIADIIRKKVKDVIVKLMTALIAFKSLEYIINCVIYACLLVGAFIDGITVIREVDISSLRKPQVLVREERLNSNASNLVPLLFLVGKGRLPDEVLPALKVLLNTDYVSGYFEPTPDGRVVMKLVVDDLELMPTCIPNGVWKVLAIETALLLKPTLLVIDEFENSLHAEIQKYLLDELRSSGTTAIVTTHSPIPVDYARTLNEVLVLELRGGETVATRLRDSKELREKLSKLGLTPSEALLYGFLELKE